MKEEKETGSGPKEERLDRPKEVGRVSRKRRVPTKQRVVTGKCEVSLSERVVQVFGRETRLSNG